MNLNFRRLPWNQDSLFGLFGELCFSVLYGVTYCIISGSLSLLFISISLHHLAFCEMFRHSVRKLNIPDKSRNNAQFLCNVIRFHRSVKRWRKFFSFEVFYSKVFIQIFLPNLKRMCRLLFSWFFKTADVYSSCVLVNLIGFIITLASAIFQIDVVNDISNLFWKIFW